MEQNNELTCEGIDIEPLDQYVQPMPGLLILRYKRTVLTIGTSFCFMLMLVWLVALVPWREEIVSPHAFSLPERLTHQLVASEGSFSLLVTSDHQLVAKHNDHIVWQMPEVKQMQIGLTEGTVILLSANATLVAISLRNGDMKWSRTLPFALPVLSRLIAMAGKIYLISTSGFSHAGTLTVLRASDGRGIWWIAVPPASKVEVTASLVEVTVLNGVSLVRRTPNGVPLVVNH